MIFKTLPRDYERHSPAVVIYAGKCGTDKVVSGRPEVDSLKLGSSSMVHNTTGDEGSPISSAYNDVGTRIDAHVSAVVSVVPNRLQNISFITDDIMLVQQDFAKQMSYKVLVL